MENILLGTVKDLVTDDFRTAAVFEKYAIDFCCGGKKTLGAACVEKGVDLGKILADLREVKSGQEPAQTQFADQELDTLIDFVVANHHGYVRRAVPLITAHTEKIAQVHGKNHPELLDVAHAFQAVAEELLNHMMKEERVLFPSIKHLASTAKEAGLYVAPPFGTIQNPIRMMETEHQAAGDALSFMRISTGGYVLPADACTTYRVTFSELEEFEKDLHQHVHIENNILFPRAILLEKDLAARN